MILAFINKSMNLLKLIFVEDARQWSMFLFILRILSFSCVIPYMVLLSSQEGFGAFLTISGAHMWESPYSLFCSLHLVIATPTSRTLSSLRQPRAQSRSQVVLQLRSSLLRALNILGCWPFVIKFRTALSIKNKTCYDFDWDLVQPFGGFGENRHRCFLIHITVHFSIYFHHLQFLSTMFDSFQYKDLTSFLPI